MWCFNQGFSGWSMFGGIGMMILWVGLLALVTWGIVSFIKNNQNKVSSGALDIAKERYARGEITKAEYDELRKNL